MDEVSCFFRAIERLDASPTEVIAWMHGIIKLGQDYATNGPARPQENDTEGRDCVTYAVIALKLLVSAAEAEWESRTP